MISLSGLVVIAEVFGWRELTVTILTMSRIDNYDSAVMTDMTMVRQTSRIQTSMSQHLSVVVKDIHKKAPSVKIGQMIMDSIISIRRIRLRGLQILHKSSKRFISSGTYRSYAIGQHGQTRH